MTIVERITPMPPVDSTPGDYKRDSITLTWDARREGHGRRTSDSGLEFAISLPGGTVLKAGDCLLLEAEQTIVVVREANEPVYVTRPKTPQDWAYCAYHVGNRHQPVMIGASELIFLQNPAVKSVLEQLHVEYVVDMRAFTAALASVGHAHE